MVRSSLFVSLAAAVLSVLAVEQPSQDVVPGAYIIELEEGKDPGAVYRAVQKEGTTRMRLDYELFRGVSVQMDDVKRAPHRAAKIAAMPAVKNMWPVRLYNMPKPRVGWVGAGPEAGPEAGPGRLAARSAPPNATDTFTPHVMTQVDRLRARGVTGRGVRIAVIDTGIDYLHPALGGCFGKGCRVGFGTDLVGDRYNGSNTPEPDADPMDCDGHGTHVAGIVAAQAANTSFGFSGAAPDAELGAYRVFGCKGQVSNDVLIAAYNRAFDDGADVITASVGGPSGWAEDPWAAAVARIVARGVPCTVSAGNEGDQGLLYASGAADGRGVTAVASVDSADTPTLLYGLRYAVGAGPPDGRAGYVPAEPAAWDGVTLPLRATSLGPGPATGPAPGGPAVPGPAAAPGPVADDACAPPPANNGTATADLAGHIALVRRGGCTFAEKAAHVAARGGRHVLFYNDAAVGAIAAVLTDVPAIAAGGMVTAAVGEAWAADLRAGRAVTLHMAGPARAERSLLVERNDATGGAVSAFSSWGPTWEMDLKPQVGAPGGGILSTYPRALGGYAVLSGTSMACPLAAAIVALVGQVRGSFDPATLDAVLSATARPQRFNDGKAFAPFLAPAAQQGGGLVQAFDAAYATTLLAPSGLSFNDSDHAPAGGVRFSVTNAGRRPVSYRLSHMPAVTMYALAAGSIYPAPFPNEAVEGAAAALRLSCEALTLAPGQSATVRVEAVPPPGLDARRLALWSGWVAVNGSDGSALSIPYQGLTGSLHHSPVLAADAVWISRSTDKKNAPLPANASFVLPAPGTAWPGYELPALVANPALGSPLLRADIVPLAPTSPRNVTTTHRGVKTIGQPYGFPSRWNTRGPNAYPWDGRLDSGNYAPPGQYKFVVRALRIFGDARNESDWDVSESPALRVRYA